MDHGPLVGGSLLGPLDTLASLFPFVGSDDGQPGDGLYVNLLGSISSRST
jgi:hypothetical protein